MKAILTAALGLIACASLQSAPSDRSLMPAAQTDTVASLHRSGRFGMPVNSFGAQFLSNIPGQDLDYFTGRPLVDGQFPVTDVRQLVAAGLCVASISDADTLLSTTYSPIYYRYEFQSVVTPLSLRSTVADDSLLRTNAVSEWDLSFTATDDEGHFGYPYHGLGVELTQSSFTWSLPGLRDIVFVSFTLRNISGKPIDTLVLGMYLSEAFRLSGRYDNEPYPDMCGFRRVLAHDGSLADDSLDMIWLADETGNLEGRYETLNLAMQDAVGFVSIAAPQQSPMHMTWFSYRTGLIGATSPTYATDAFNWEDDVSWQGETARMAWLLARAHPRPDLAYMKQAFVEDPNWLGSPHSLDSLKDPEVFASLAPISLGVNDSVTWVTAFVGGEHFHTSPDNFRQTMVDAYDPDAYYAGLDFSDLNRKARMAMRLYDTPGVDTDTDGVAGTYELHDGDTVWISGDGVPDWRPALPPASPEHVRVEYDADSAIIRFNGLSAETRPDRITGANLFEGYRIYRGGPSDKMTMTAAWDRENYVLSHYDGSGWFAHYRIFSLHDLRCTYGASCSDDSFDPLSYTPSKPMLLFGSPDSLICFDRYGLNNALSPTSLHKVYPDQPYPTSLDPAVAQPDELTSDSLLKYFEYEYIVHGLSVMDTVFLSLRAIGSGPAARFAAIQESDGKAGLVRLALPSACCQGMRGNFDGSADDEPDPVDLSVFVDALFSGGPQPPCELEIDVNGDGEPADGVDLSYLVDYLFSGGPPPPDCP